MQKLNIPQQIENVLKSLLHKWMEGVCAQVESCVPVDEIEVSEVEHESRAGFMPYTNGGLQVSIWSILSYAQSSGNYFHPAIRDFIEKQQDLCFDMFKHDKGLDSEMSLSEVWDNEELKEEYWDYENEWMTEAYYIGASVYYYGSDNYYNPLPDKVDCLYFKAYYNLSEYGEERNNVNICEMTIPLSELTGKDKIVKLKQVKDMLWQFI